MGIVDCSYSSFDYPVPIKTDDAYPFNVKLPIQRSWESSKRRLLLIYENVDSGDIKNKKLLTSEQGTLLDNLLKHGLAYAKNCKTSAPVVPSIAAINFDYFRCRHLSMSLQEVANQSSVYRIKKYIQKIKPTDIFVFGSLASFHLEGMDEITTFMLQGRPIKRDGIWWTRGPNLAGAYQNKRDGEVEESQKIANLAGFLSRCFGNSLVRDLVYKIDFEPNYTMISSLQEWKKLFSRLMNERQFSLDTETENLSKKFPVPLFFQFAFDASMTFIVPIYHKDTPFNKKQIEQIRQDLKTLLSLKFDPLSITGKEFILGQNLKFDMTVCREWLGINVIQWPLWDLMAGEYIHDENLIGNRSSGGRGKTSFSLEWITRWYGCDFYSENEFGKEDRGNIKNLDINTKGLKEYMAADAQIPWLVYREQIRRAKNRIQNKEPYHLYRKMVLLQMSSIIHSQSMAEHRGDHLDIKWLKSLLVKKGPLDQVRTLYEQEFRQLKSVKRVNRRMLEEQGLSTTSMFGTDNWVFSVTKPSHKHELFFNELNLEPLAEGKTGPKIDKEFQEHYAHIPEVASFKQLAQVGKVRSTYVVGFLKKLHIDPDMVDHCLRPKFGYLDTVTGRANSSDPNLQNIIQRGPLAKLIKRSFVPPKGYLTIKLDYSAHEVRMWAIEAQDTLLAQLFVTGRWLRQQYRKTGNPALKFLMKTIGDIHRVNCRFFFQVSESKATDEQRDSVKSIVFGSIYGRSATSIAKQAKQSVDIIKNLIKKFFARFSKGLQYLEKQRKMAITKNHTVSLIGRVRNIYSHWFGVDSLTAGAQRRGANAPIQGISSDLGQTAAYLFEIHMQRYVEKFGLREGYFDTGITSFVHDALKAVTKADLFLPSIQILQWCCTIGICEYFSTHFGVRFYVEPEIEFELGTSDDSLEKWDWHDKSLDEIIENTLKKHAEIYSMSSKEVSDMRKEIYSVRGTKMQDYLDKHYPILADWKDSIHIDTTSKEFKNGLNKILVENGVTL